MKMFQPILIAVAGILALSACASAPPAQRAPAPAALVKAPPPVASGMILPVAAEVSAYGAANTGGTYPYGVAQQAAQETTQGFAIKVSQEAPQEARTETTEGVVVMGPDGTVWQYAGGASAAYRGDVDSCYAYARGQVDHDARIESDVAAAFDSDSASFGLTALRARMSNFERTNRVPVLFSSCMMTKGYNRQ